MDNNILATIITASGAIFAAALTYYLTKKKESDITWRNEKLAHYRNLLSAISDLASDGMNNEDANLRFASTANTIALVAPQKVITALMNFHDEIKFTNENRSLEKHDELLIQLLLSIRKDIRIGKKDNLDTFQFHLIGKSPKRKAQ